MKKKNKKPAKPANKLKLLHIDIYDFDLFYLISDWAKCVKVLKTKFNHHDVDSKQLGTGFALPVERDDLGDAYFIWIDERASDQIKIHECFHATKYIMNNHCGCDLTNASEEAYAYLMAFICAKVMSLIVK